MIPSDGTEVDVVVIGAGQAGLSSAYHLGRAGFAAGSGYVVLDADEGPGGAWQHRWPTLRFGAAHRLYPLPGYPLGAVDEDRPASAVVAEYFADFERHFDLPVHRPVKVTAVRPEPRSGSAGTPAGGVRTADGGGTSGDGTADGGVTSRVGTADGGGMSGGTSGGGVGTADGRVTGEVGTAPDRRGRLLVESSAGTWAPRALVNATGTWTRPFWPAYPGASSFRGRQLHTVDYRRPQEFAGRHVVVVGGGNSAVQLLAEISTWTTTTWVARRDPVWYEGPFDETAGREAIARVQDAVRAGRPPASVVSVTGLGLTPAVAAARERGVLVRRPMFERITPTGVTWPGGETVAADVILWCTGFRAALDHLSPLHLREPGGGIRTDGGTRVIADPRIHLVGYGPSASTIGANRAGRIAARSIATLLHR